MDLRKVESVEVNWNHLAQDRAWLEGLVSRVMNLPVL